MQKLAIQSVQLRADAMFDREQLKLMFWVLLDGSHSIECAEQPEQRSVNREFDDRLQVLLVWGTEAGIPGCRMHELPWGFLPEGLSSWLTVSSIAAA